VELYENSPVRLHGRHKDSLTFQYDETNVMHFSFNLLRVKGLYMFRALFARPQEAPHKRHFVYCVHIMSVGCGTVAVQLCHGSAMAVLRVCVVPKASIERNAFRGKGEAIPFLELMVP
jgi:hypothetical protein